MERKYITGLVEWFLRLISGRPHFAIGGDERPYMLRWYLLPRNPCLNFYLHKFLRDDDDRALHDHPWWFVSIMLWGSYAETLERHLVGETFWFYMPQVPSIRSAPSVAFRNARDRHRVTLKKDSAGNPIPCWTLVITGPKSREWGFWCPKGFVPWQKFVAADDPGAVGPGCGD